MVGHFYKGVANECSSMVRVRNIFMVSASLLITFGILFSLLSDIQKQVL